MTERVVATEQDRATFHPIPGIDGYEINLLGQVRSLSRYVNSPAAGGRRLLRTKLMSVHSAKGYPSFNARVMGRTLTVYIHRCLAAIFIPNPEGKPNINHKDGNKANFDLANLEWCTHAENMRHAFDTGLTPRPKSGPGSLSPAARLNAAQVTAIRQLVASGADRGIVARHYEVSRSNVNQIVSRTTWKEVP